MTFAETEEIARTAMNDVSARRLPAAVYNASAELLEADPEAAGVTVKVSTTQLPAEALGDQSVGYRSVIAVSQGRTRMTANADLHLHPRQPGTGLLRRHEAGCSVP